MSRKTKEIQPYWHPNFRMPSTLPDIKVVRTDFIVNFIAVLVLVVVAFFVLQREYRAYVMRGSIAGLERRIQEAEPEDDRYLKLNERFRAASQQVIELEHFYSAPFLPQQLVPELVRLRPKGFAFDGIGYSEEVKKQGKKFVMEYHVSISGHLRSLNELTAFKHALQDSELLQVSGYETGVFESDKGRDSRTGIFSCQIEIRIVPEKPGAKAKKGKAGS